VRFLFIVDDFLVIGVRVGFDMLYESSCTYSGCDVLDASSFYNRFF
jgi:hypothetical protein